MSLAKSSAEGLAIEADACYAWPGPVDWEFYCRMLRLRGDRRVPRMVYLDGTLTLMTPSLPHEERKERLRSFVHEVIIGCRLPHRPTGSTTWRRRGRRGGVEGDLTFYLASEPAVRGKQRINLRNDPPPDLAIEVVYSHDATRALEVYRRLGVPEVWIATDREFSIRTITGEGRSRRYQESDRSRAFPFLEAAEIAGWLDRDSPDGETRWCAEVRDWVAGVLVPRRAAGGPAPRTKGGTDR